MTIENPDDLAILSRKLELVRDTALNIVDTLERKVIRQNNQLSALEIAAEKDDTDIEEYRDTILDREQSLLELEGKHSVLKATFDKRGRDLTAVQGTVARVNTQMAELQTELKLAKSLERERWEDVARKLNKKIQDLEKKILGTMADYCSAYKAGWDKCADNGGISNFPAWWQSHKFQGDAEKVRKLLGEQFIDGVSVRQTYTDLMSEANKRIAAFEKKVTELKEANESLESSVEARGDEQHFR